LGDLRGVITLAATDVDPVRRRALGSQFGETLGNRRVMSGVEEVAAGLGPRPVVARGAAGFVLPGPAGSGARAGAVEAGRGGGHDAVIR